MGSFLKKKRQFLTLVYDSSGMTKHAVFDFFGNEKIPIEMMTLVNYLKVSHQKRN
jgi:hypothetical protein